MTGCGALLFCLMLCLDVTSFFHHVFAVSYFLCLPSCMNGQTNLWTSCSDLHDSFRILVVLIKLQISWPKNKYKSSKLDLIILYEKGDGGCNPWQDYWKRVKYNQKTVGYMLFHQLLEEISLTEPAGVLFSDYILSNTINFD